MSRRARSASNAGSGREAPCSIARRSAADTSTRRPSLSCGMPTATRARARLAPTNPSIGRPPGSTRWVAIVAPELLDVTHYRRLPVVASNNLSTVAWSDGRASAYSGPLSVNVLLAAAVSQEMRISAGLLVTDPRIPGPPSAGLGRRWRRADGGRLGGLRSVAGVSAREPLGVVAWGAASAITPPAPWGGGPCP